MLKKYTEIILDFSHHFWFSWLICSRSWKWFKYNEWISERWKETTNLEKPISKCILLLAIMHKLMKVPRIEMIKQEENYVIKCEWKIYEMNLEWKSKWCSHQESINPLLQGFAVLDEMSSYFLFVFFFFGFFFLKV